MSALLQSLTQDQADSAAAEAILRTGLPGPRSEAWKYTSLRALERRQFAPAQKAAIHADVIASIPAPRVVFVNGFFDSALSRVEDLPHGLRIDTQIALNDEEIAIDENSLANADAVFSNLNRIGAQHGLRLVAATTGTMQTVHLVCIAAGEKKDSAWQLRHNIVLETGAQLSVVEHHLAIDQDASFLANTAMAIHLAPGAIMSHVRLQTQLAERITFLRTDVALDGEAHYQRTDLDAGGALSRHELNVRLQGANASAAINGVLLGDAKRHFDTQLDIAHLTGNTNSSTRYRGLAADRARVAFRGGITIHSGADGSDAQLSSRNLLLSDAAEIDAQPAMEIHADEVKAAHGATVGQLDATALFYLRSRGIPEPEARQILTTAFCADVLSAIDTPTVRELAERHLLDALTRLQKQS